MANTRSEPVTVDQRLEFLASLIELPELGNKNELWATKTETGWRVDVGLLGQSVTGEEANLVDAVESAFRAARHVVVGQVALGRENRRAAEEMIERMSPIVELFGHNASMDCGPADWHTQPDNRSVMNCRVHLATVFGIRDACPMHSPGDALGQSPSESGTSPVAT